MLSPRAVLMAHTNAEKHQFIPNLFLSCAFTTWLLLARRMLPQWHVTSGLRIETLLEGPKCCLCHHLSNWRIHSTQPKVSPSVRPSWAKLIGSSHSWNSWCSRCLIIIYLNFNQMVRFSRLTGILFILIDSELNKFSIIPCWLNRKGEDLLYDLLWQRAFKFGGYWDPCSFWFYIYLFQTTSTGWNIDPTLFISFDNCTSNCTPESDYWLS